MSVCRSSSSATFYKTLRVEFVLLVLKVIDQGQGGSLKKAVKKNFEYEMMRVYGIT